MSAPSSPRPSFESEEHPVSNGSTAQATEAASTRAHSPRRRSIQFSVGGTESQLPTRSMSFKDKRRSYGESPTKEESPDKDSKHLAVNRGPSPPPPKTYERGVSFDTFDNRDAADFSLTLNYKHKGYQSTRRSRTFLCGTDQNDYSEFALEWLIDELVDDGDEIVCLRAVEKDSRMASDAAIEEGKYRQEAEKLFEQVIQKNSQDEKAISLVLELAVGKVEDIIQRMIRIYEPALLVVGTRGRNLKGVHSLLPGSVSKYCLQQSPIPVIVVRPSPKREKKKKKRRADPTRRSYNHILEMSSRRGSRIFDASSSTESSTSRLPDEEAAVAEALGLPASYANSRTSLSDRSSLSHEDAETRNSLDDRLMKSPLSESPTSSEESISISEDTQRPHSPDEPPGESSSSSPPPFVDRDSSENAQPSSPEITTTQTDADESDSTKQNRISIPTIEVSNDNDDEKKEPDER
ncbi:hypothetical protein N7474_010758 [Penicillium riverlandense]|uniref:uncharacterized protein n=1 Tax=Penicillium riverlandense TaxID=1903569 RepID=UPI002547C9FA|nr:uncharacterized protein N7474_010758 [Penicillium riverlandense]KAJ5804871.1 hypothetical protein N7474_010758 [Penicillium riverlandense]